MAKQEGSKFNMEGLHDCTPAYAGDMYFIEQQRRLDAKGWKVTKAKERVSIAHAHFHVIFCGHWAMRVGTGSKSPTIASERHLFEFMK